MALPKETTWNIQPHTKAKHEILRRYLNAWFPILSRRSDRIVYIDGFAGPGRYRGGEPGSPLIALEVATAHRMAIESEIVFWFIDEDERRIKNLQQEIEKLELPAHFKVYAECGRFDEKLGAILDDLESNNLQLAPTFCFVDPFGFSGVPFSLVKRLLGYKRSELLVTFMVDAVKRFLGHSSPGVAGHIVDLYGTDAVLDLAKTQDDPTRRLRELYQSQLKSAAQFVRYFEMRDKRNRPLYYLFFATNHPLGHVRMKEAMWKVDPAGEFRFSDATDPTQLVLFGVDPVSGLAEQLRRKFGGRSNVDAKEVREYVENETAYLKKHMTAALRQEEKAGLVRVRETKANGKKRKPGTYPDGVLLTFCQEGTQ